MIGRPKRPSPNDLRHIPYPEVRDRFLTASQKTNRVAWLVEVGRFVEDRWLSEEALRPKGQPLDETASWHLWDECSEKYLRDLRTEARQLLQRELGRRRAAAFIANWRGNVKPLQAAAQAAAWIFAQAGKAIVGAISVIAFGLAVLWLFPGVVGALHSSINRLLPSEANAAVTATDPSSKQTR